MLSLCTSRWQGLPHLLVQTLGSGSPPAPAGEHAAASPWKPRLPVWYASHPPPTCVVLLPLRQQPRRHHLHMRTREPSRARPPLRHHVPATSYCHVPAARHPITPRPHAVIANPMQPACGHHSPSPRSLRPPLLTPHAPRGHLHSPPCTPPPSSSCRAPQGWPQCFRASCVARGHRSRGQTAGLGERNCPCAEPEGEQGKG